MLWRTQNPTAPFAVPLSSPPLLLALSQWEFLVQEMGAGAEDLLAYPPYLASSLLNETGPRQVPVPVSLTRLHQNRCDLFACGNSGQNV